MNYRCNARMMVTIIVAAALYIGCEQGKQADVPPASTPQAPAVDAPPPDPPREFRRISLVPIPEGARLIESLHGSSANPDARQRLVEIYQAAGYRGAARFFENSLRELRGDELLFTPVRNEIGWALTERDLSGAADEAARTISDLIFDGKYVAAVEAAQRDIETHGTSQQVAVEWSQAVWWVILFTPEKVSPEVFEIATRVYLMSLEEKISQAIGMHSKHTGYDSLARVFLRVGDMASCRTAAKLALHHLNLSASSQEWETLAAERLRELLHQASGGAQ